MTRCIALLAAVLLAATLAGCGSEETTASAEVRPVQTLVVGASSQTQGATYSGTVEARHLSQQGFQVAGTVARRLTEVGARVKKGDALLQLDLADLQYKEQQARAHLDAAQTQAAQAKVNLGRSKMLVDQDFVSQAQYDESKLQYEQALSNLSAAQAQYGEAENALSYGTLRAAVSGIVTAINVDVGDVVQPGKDAVDIARDGGREVVISVPESRLNEVREAQGLSVTLWAAPQHSYQAKLRVLYPDTSNKTSTYEGRIALLDADSHVHLGMTAYVHVPGASGQQGFAVPLTAIYDEKGDPRLWVIGKDSKVTARPVKIASLSGDYALIAAGIKAGEVIVTAGVQMLHDGQQVKPVGTYFPQSR